MTFRPSIALRSLAAAALAVALAACGAPSDGLGQGEPAPRATAQATPDALWPAWSGAGPESGDNPGAASEQPPPEPLAGAPDVPAGGIGAMDVRAILRADPRMKAFARFAAITGPGREGLRPPVLHDLTGDGKPELIVAVDLESGRSGLAVYTARGGKAVPVLHTSGARLEIEEVGGDLVVRGASADGAEQAVRFHWDGRRLSTVSEVKSYREGLGPDLPKGPS